MSCVGLEAGAGGASGSTASVLTFVGFNNHPDSWLIMGSLIEQGRIEKLAICCRWDMGAGSKKGWCTKSSQQWLHRCSSTPDFFSSTPIQLSQSPLLFSVGTFIPVPHWDWRDCLFTTSPPSGRAASNLLNRMGITKYWVICLLVPIPLTIKQQTSIE